MDKGLLLLLNPKSRKPSNKPAIDTKVSMAQVPKVTEAQSTKSSSKPNPNNSIPTYRLMQYVNKMLTFNLAKASK